MTSSRTTNLNEAQAQAVEVQEGPFLVLAGAGSGKTKVLTQRIVHLVRDLNADPTGIMAVTFTNKAAREMLQRLGQEIPKELCTRMWVGTFHGLCNRFLRQEIGKLRVGEHAWTSNFVILDSDESLRLIKDSLATLDIDQKANPPKTIQNQIRSLKNEGLLPSDYWQHANDHRARQLAEIYSKYQEKLCLSNALDFDDLLMYVIKILAYDTHTRRYYHERFGHVLVDEFQDTNQVQFDLLKYIVLPPEGPQAREWQGRSFCAVGDIDQSIYSWRGADYRLALNFQRDFPEANLIKLEYNYRSRQNILTLANSVIRNNQERIDKTLICTRDTGDRVTCLEAASDLEEAEYVATETERLRKRYSLDDMAVLYRTNAQSRVLEEALLRRRIPYRLIGGMKFYERLEVKDLLAYLRLIHNPKDATALKRVINTPRRGIGANTVAVIESRADARSTSLYEVIDDLMDDDELPAKATRAVHDFRELLDGLREDSASMSVSELFQAVVDRTGYLEALRALPNDDEAQARIDNVHELLGVARQFEEENGGREAKLVDFLSQVALTGDADQPTGSEGKLTLLTIHSAKGLEFPCVFLVGLEDGTFPHMHSLLDASRLEEERRLMYVAITRAEDLLYLTFARRRRFRGKTEYCEPSRFLAEMPRELLSGYWGASLASPEDRKKPRSNRGETPDSRQTGFEVGEGVRHSTFGKGKVTGIFGGKKQKFYAVEFERESGKKLLSAASLKPAET